jgi:hypothetical protein
MADERRTDQTEEHPGRRREDALLELVNIVIAKNDELTTTIALGERNFRSYRHRAFVAFLLLVSMSSVGLGLAEHNRRGAQVNLTHAVQEVTRGNCDAGNDLRAGLRGVVLVAFGDRPKLRRAKRFALNAFADRDCAAVAVELQHLAAP